MTTELQANWEKEWQAFKEVSSNDKMAELQPILSHLSEVLHVLHKSINEQDDCFQSLGFRIGISDDIQIIFKSHDTTDKEMTIVCEVEFGENIITFSINENDSRDLVISLN